jgi:hypothetical protein
MVQPKCSCERFDKLEGASVPAYIKAFLEQADGPAHVEKNRYRCRVCGSLWEQRAPALKSEGTRASLVRLSR